jgi:superfamily II DNA or RNA helicase
MSVYFPMLFFAGVWTPGPAMPGVIRAVAYCSLVCTPAPEVATSFAATSWPGTFRRQQAEALDALATVWDGGRRRAWLALPPGAGKTLVGLEAARRLGRPAVIFGPNTAIQAQWVQQWSAFTPATVEAGADRALSTPVTALTYQSLAVFDPDAEVDEEGHETLTAAGPGRRSSLLATLHANGRALVDALHDAGPITLILDEAHHLLEVWGALLAELLDVLPDAHVVGLTATPPQTLTPDQADLVDRLFGHPIYHAAVPGLVRDGYLAPFAELAWLSAPTPAEDQWLHAEAERFTELRTDLVDPAFATIGLFEWLDRRFVSRAGEHGSTVSWARLEKTKPELATAAVRLHAAGLLGLPDGARVREEHRREPTAADWVAILDDYIRHFLHGSVEPLDQQALGRIKQALPSLGYRLTKRGIRAGRSPVDRVLARSEAKTHGCVEIVAWEATTLGDRLRALVLCDHERASATLPARLAGVLDPEAGSARLMLANLLADPRTSALSPVLVTGRTVAAAASTARDFVAWTDEVDLDPVPADAAGLVEITGRWSSRIWVRIVTRFFEEGRCQVLVGTRGLLGEGWNAPSVNTLIDLTTATTPTAVVQTRGRALRTDPSWPDKVATNWSVVCVSEEHPGGDSDWGRFVRKHDGYLAVDNTGEIIDGVAHVDDRFSPYQPPPAAEFDAVNAHMLERSADHDRTHKAWQVGTPYDDRLVHELRTVPSRRQPPVALATGRPTELPAFVPAARGIVASAPLDGRRQHTFNRRAVDVPFAVAPFVATLAGVFAIMILVQTVLVQSSAIAVLFGVSALPLAFLAAYIADRYGAAKAAGALIRDVADRQADLDAIAHAVADGLHRRTRSARRGRCPRRGRSGRDVPRVALRSVGRRVAVVRHCS